MTQVNEGTGQDARTPMTRPWWLMGRTRGEAWLQLLITVLLVAAFILRDFTLETLDLLFLAVGAGLVIAGVMSVIAFSRHRNWNNAAFTAPTDREVRVYAWFVGILAVAGTVCVVLAFALSAWGLCGLALVFFLGAVGAGSNLGSRTGAK